MAISVVRIVKGLIFLLLVFVLVRGIIDTEKAVLFYLISVTIPTVALFLLSVKRFGFDAKRFTIGEGLQVLGESVPIGIASILSNYNIFAGTLIAGYMLTESELGYFTAAHRLVVFLWAYIIVTFHRVLIPTLTRYFHETKSAYVRFVKRFFNLSVIAAIPFGMFGSLAGAHIISLLYPDQYARSTQVLELLLWSFSLAMSRSIFEIALIASDKQRRYSYGVVLVSIAYTVVTPILILNMGIVGAALSCLVVEAGYFIALLFSFPYAGTSILGRDLWKPIVAAAAGIVPALMLPSDLRSWFFPVALALYMLVLVISKGVSAQDYDLLRSVLGKKAVEA